MNELQWIHTSENRCPTCGGPVDRFGYQRRDFEHANLIEQGKILIEGPPPEYKGLRLTFWCAQGHEWEPADA